MMALARMTIALFHLGFSISASVLENSIADVPGIPSIAVHFSTKGRYEEVNTYLINDILAVNATLPLLPSAECRAVHLTAVIRHGTRYPTTKNVRKMRDFYDLVQTNASDWMQAVGLSEWKMWYTDDMDGRLVRKGQEDHTHLAQRLAKSFPTLINEDNLRNGRMKIITSSKHRCVNSTISFKAGLMKALGIEGEELEHEVNDALMRFFDQCPRFRSEVEDNKNALLEMDKFHRGPEMQRVYEKIADRLQVPYSAITEEMAEAALYFCAYELAIHSVNSPWCQLFDEVDAQVMEYEADLKHYWKRSYGHEINSKASCNLFHDVFKRIDKAASDLSSGQAVVSEAVTVQVGHAETLLPLLTLLGLFREATPLTASNFAHHNSARVFRAGRIVPYAGNLVLALYHCDDGLRLETRLNEQPLLLPGASSYFPLLEEVKRSYAGLLQGCDQAAECALPSAGPQVTSQ
ncbi:multiple inositol polyphosphate phosphatase 1a [Engraulis encrasicolus]|uniref:multiple inositol polyphosphate phosphatase 1a n=1 Tax=Engraulis encrasicolus TaxID=184585 RepID=UPI002FD1EF01